ncbi:MAG TPA: glycoside hydrolase family 36 protein [Bryobacteraceae bacterium]|nr:glycoside hydrolase family 36 protein [Bryobacteraceae bacterium]
MANRWFAFIAAAAVAPLAPAQVAVVHGGNIRIEFDSAMRSRAIAVLDGREHVIGPFAASDTVQLSGASLPDFSIVDQKRESVRDRLGSGSRTLITGAAGLLKKVEAITVYDRFPRMAFFDVQYTNTGTADLKVSGWTSQHYVIAADTSAGQPAFWSYQSGSYEKRPDWVLPLKPGFKQDNFMGMNASDYGGGTPVVDVWRRDAGLAVGHVERAPKLVSLPVTMADSGNASVAVEYRHDQVLKPGETMKTFRTFVAVHRGDYFQALRDYRDVMVAEGVHFDKAPDSAFGPIWCAWGYGRKMTPAQLFGALPVVKKLGFTWVTLDDGWQTAQGDWFLNPQKYPRGDADMRALVDKIHAQGFKAQLWWAPLAADPGTELVRNHPEMLLLNADGSKQIISYWNSWYLCPADPAVVAYHKAIVVKAIRDWGFDGLKLDGQFMNGAPPCYNPAHHHLRPEDSVEGMPQFFRALYDMARQIKPDALVEFCPCGTGYNFYTLPFMNMTVASDPESAWQVRLKGKTLKALQGDGMAYFGDHVDMVHDDLASTVGVGGVVGTDFRWPPGSASSREGKDLTPEREQLFAKWLGIYKDKMLSRGEYLGTLYDIGFDKPETHAIRRNGNIYYAFYAPQWSGKLTLRGLGAGNYRVTDYVDGRDLGTVRGPDATLDIRFEKHLLIEAKPE